MSQKHIFTATLVTHIAELSNIPLQDEDEVQSLVSAFRETLETIDFLNDIDTSETEPAHHVSGLTNQLRSDTHEPKREFSQEEALRNATRSHQGFFVVPRVISDNQQ